VGLALLLGCTSIRPVVKIGLLAPFEGLYRRTGYDALGAIRTAINEVGPGQVDLLPLALDDSNDPARAAQKLLRDPALQAIIGPVLPTPLVRVTAVLNRYPLAWFSPLTIGPAGFLQPANQTQALTDLVTAVAVAAQMQGARRLVLAGDSGLDAPQWPKSLALPVVVLADPTAITDQDAVFWLGDAAAAADFLTRLRVMQPQVPFWLGTQAEDPVFMERTAIRTGVYWAAWADRGYDQWAQTHNPTTLYAYQCYAAAKQAINQIIGSREAKQAVWQIHLFTLLPDGHSRPLVQT
jgi:branched-chain amino acid transport system substrate-binding protein